MWTHFLLEIVHFAISFFSALVFLAAFWLYFDSRKRRRNVRDMIRCGGFLLLSLSFVVSSVILETSVLNVSMIKVSSLIAAQLLLRTVGYTCILFAAITDKLQPRPKEHETLVLIPSLAISFMLAQFLPALLSLGIAIAYLIRSMIGLEVHIRKASIAFFLFAFAETLSLCALFRETTNPTLFRLVEPFQLIWIVQHVVLLLATLMLAKWVFGYLLKQFEPQLFIIFSVGVLSIFLITTTTFTGLLLKNIQDETLRQLENDVKVLQYALKSKRSESVSNAVALSQDPEIGQYILSKDRIQLGSIAEQFLLSKQYSNMVILDSNGQIIARGEDKENVGSYLASDPLIKRALADQALAAITTTDGVLAPQILLQAAAPVRVDNKVVGVVMIATNIDNTFVDGIKKETGLEASMYGSNILSATTLFSLDDKTRLTGLTENNQEITRKVLGENENYSGSVTIGNVPYFAVLSPLLDADNNPVGMIFVGREQLSVMQTASRSIELTFVLTALMLVGSVVPSYLITRYIAYQLH